jgi:carbonic anhydrase
VTGQVDPPQRSVHPSTRRRFLVGGAAALAAVPGFGAVASGSAAATVPGSAPAVGGEHLGDDPVTPGQVLRWLVQGNRRWVAGRLVHPHQTVARRLAVAPAQHPLATVFGCIDSRVPPEIVFDRGVGDLFVVRTAAQTNDGLVQGAVEYGAEEALTPLVVVLGHQRCGAVSFAVEVLNGCATAPDHLEDVVEALRPAYEAAKPLPGDQVDNTVRAQIRLTVEQLRADAVLHPLVHAHRISVVGGYYSLDSGIVDFFVN